MKKLYAALCVILIAFICSCGQNEDASQNYVDAEPVQEPAQETVAEIDQPVTEESDHEPEPAISEADEELSARDELNELEKRIFNAFLVNIETWKNPDQIVFMDCSPSVVNPGSMTEHITIKVKGYNSFGSSSIRCYNLYLTENFAKLDDPNVVAYGEVRPARSEELKQTIEILVSPKKINAAIQEYWEEK